MRRDTCVSSSYIRICKNDSPPFKGGAGGGYLPKKNIETMLNPKKTKKQRQYLRNNMTKWEIILWNDLKGKKMYGFKVRRQYGVDNYVIDFYCPELKLALEVDGDVHYYPDKLEADKRKYKKLEEEGIQLVRLKNEDLEEDYESAVIYLEDRFKLRAQELMIPLKVDFD